MESTWVSFLIRCDAEPQWVKDVPWNWIAAKDPLHYLMAERPTYDIDGSPMPAAILDNPIVKAAGGYQVGGWDIHTGSQFGPVDEDAYEAVRPLGNSPEQTIYDSETGAPIDIISAGLATPGGLRYQQFAGSAQTELGDGSLYSDNNPPFSCECRLLENVIYGWFPRWEISMEDGADIARDPSVRNVRVFSSPDCIFPGEFLYTTGAFIYGDSLWHTDEDGSPIRVWWTESNQFVQAEEPVHFAIYWGETENGRFTVPNALEPIVRLFWEENQPSRGVLRALDRAWERGSGEHPSSKEYLNHGQQVAIHRHLLKLGFDRDELGLCDMFNGGTITAKKAALRLLQCTATGVVTAPTTGDDSYE